MVEIAGPVRDLRQSDGYAEFMRHIGWQVDRIDKLHLFRKNVPLLGAFIRIPRPRLPLPMEEIDALARSQQAFLVKVEPNFLIDGFDPQTVGGFQKDSSPILPTRTIWVDLTSSLETLLANLDKDTRNLIRRAEKDGVTILESRDLADFYRLWSGNAKKKGFYVPFENELTALWKSISEKHLLVAKYRGEIVAGALLLGHERVLYYSFAGSNDRGRDVHAPYLLMWEVLRRGKRWGYARLDLEGITDPKVGRTKNWSGFSHFKRGFGGKEVEYAGSFSKYYSFLGKIFGRFI